MWPDDNSLIILIAGLLPSLYVIYLLCRKGISEIASLRSIFLITSWIGYNLNPWIVFFKGGEPSFIIVHEYINASIIFSTLFSIAFIVGYRNISGNREYHDKSARLLSVNTFWPIIILILCTILLFFFHTIRIENIIFPNVTRAEFLQAGNLQKQDMLKYTKIFLYLISFLLVTFAVIMFIQRKNTIWNILLLTVLLMVASVNFYFEFSRASGVGFLLASVLLFRLDGNRFVKLSIILIVIAFILSAAGFEYRKTYGLGLGPFAYSVVDLVKNRDINLRNPINCVDRWTRKASLRNSLPNNDDNNYLRFLLVVNPLPRFLFPPPDIGGELTVALGTVGLMNITSPLLADIYYLFGMNGIILGILFGWCYSYFEIRWIKKRNIINLIGIIFCIGSIAIGLHSGLRATSRLIIYALMINIMYKIYRSVFVVKRGKYTSYDDRLSEQGKGLRTADA